MLELKFTGKRHDLIGKQCEKEPDCPTINQSCKMTDDNGLTVGYILKGWDQSSEVAKTVQSMKYISARRTQGMFQNNEVFGFMPRNAIRCNYCRPAALSKKNTDAWNVLMKYASKITDFIKNIDEKVYQTNMEIVAQQVKSCWRIKDSMFTSGIVNKNNHLTYHVDFGNFEGTWSAMLVYKREIKGGNIHFPEFNATVQLDDGDLVIFKSSDFVHGVTPIIRTGPDSYRYSIVYYSLEQLKKCLEPKEEMETYKKWATNSFLNKNERIEKIRKDKGLN
jgi:hypothetical protein